MSRHLSATPLPNRHAIGPTNLQDSTAVVRAFDKLSEFIRNAMMEIFDLSSTLTYVQNFENNDDGLDATATLYPSVLIRRNARSKIMDLSDGIYSKLEELRALGEEIVDAHAEVATRALRTISRDEGGNEWHENCTVSMSCVDASLTRTRRVLQEKI